MRGAEQGARADYAHREARADPDDRAGSPLPIVMDSEGPMGEPASSRKRAALLRLWKLVVVLHRTRRGRTVAELQELLPAGRSTVYRDLELLGDAGVAVERILVNGEVRHRLLGVETLAVAPTALQIAAARLARDALGPLEGTALVRELDGLLAQWSSAPPPGVRVSRRRTGRGRAAILATVEAAMTTGRRVLLEYQGHADPAPRRREVDPLTLRLEHDDPYLFAFCHQRRDYRLFKLARVAAAQLGEAPAGDHSGVDLDALLAHSVKVWLGGEPVELVVRLSPRKARFAAEYPLVPDQRVESAPDGSALIRARVSGNTEALRWVLGWGADAEILAPPALRAAARDELAAAARLYTDGPTRGEAQQVVSHRWDGAGGG